MSLNKTTIAWCDYTCNPVVGCTPIGGGCQNCYAERLHMRRYRAWLRHNADSGKPCPFANSPQYHKPFSVIQLLPQRLDDLRRAPAGARVFVNSTSDLFHEQVPEEFAWRVLAACRVRDVATFIVATKRIARASKIPENFWPSNLWLLTSVSTQADADRDKPHLLEIPAAVRGISLEPMIERVDLRLSAEGLDWVIVGAESGPNRRPCKIAWIRDVVQQCQAAGVPVFIKQMEVGGKIVKKPFLDGRQWLELPDARRGDE